MCIFCEIAKKNIPAAVVYEDEHCLAFEDLDKKAPVHVLFIPKVHIESAAALEENPEVAMHLFSAMAKYAKDMGLVENGYRIVTNVGPDAGQTVMHLHYHFLAGRNLSWPPG